MRYGTGGNTELRCEHVTDHKPACVRCGRTMAWLVTRPWRLQCPRCRLTNQSPDLTPARTLATT